jgi:hypothetical protein
MRKTSTLQSADLSPEFRLAVATSVWPQGPDRNQRIAAAMAAVIDWDLFVRVVRRHRIDGLAFHALTAASAVLPNATRISLQTAAERQANKSLIYAGEAIRVSRLLRDAGIPVASLKGASLSMLAFGDLALRHCRDIDLLVRPSDALRADEVLTAAGYQLEMPIGPHSPKQKQHWVRRRKHFEYKGSGGIPLELHWRLFDNPRLFATEVEPSSWSDVSIPGRNSLQTLSSSDLLLYLCVHGANHMWFRLKWLADVQALLRQSQPDAVQRLKSDAATHHCERAVAQTLALTRLLFDVPSSDVVTPVDAATSALVRSALVAMTSGAAASELETVPFGTSRLAAARYRLRQDWRFWFQEINSLLADERDRESLGLPHSMRFLLPILRLPLWMGRRIRGRGQSRR